LGIEAFAYNMWAGDKKYLSLRRKKEHEKK